MDIYCMLCGERLLQENKQVSCVKCNTEYKNILVSETQNESIDHVITEMSISMDTFKRTTKIEQPTLFQISEIYTSEKVQI
jgi:hypothetical protein